MPIFLGSRYSGLSISDITDSDGKINPAIHTRLITPKTEDQPSNIIKHVVEASETLDVIAVKYYNDPKKWWIIADANPTIFPLDIAAGEVIDVPHPRVANKL